jgi:hypothetical protein
MARIANLLQAIPQRCRLRSGSCADGHGDAFGGEPFGDGVDTESGEELGEDPTDHTSCRLVYPQDVQPLAVCRFGRVRVRPGVNQQVPVGRAPTQIPALHLGLGGHGGADPDLDPVPLAFAEAAERRHDPRT